MSKLLETVDLETNFYTYEGVVRALNQVSIVVERGVTFGLVGESGCGKSVTVRSIMRIVQEPGKIEGGQVLIYLGDENAPPLDLLDKSEAYMRSIRGNLISMIFQEPNAALNPTMSIGDQIAESFLFHRKKDMCQKIVSDLSSGSNHKGLLGTFDTSILKIVAENPEDPRLAVFGRIPFLNGWKRRIKKEALVRSVDILSKLGIPNPENVVRMYPHNLSGGMKQRIVIAIALACSPVLLIADEATSNLDVTIQAQILDLIKRLKEEVITSILLITHDLGVVAETCDRVGVMYAGNLCEVADVEDLFERPLHPYTRALLNSVPKFSTKGELQSIEGNVPNLVAPPTGCRFHPRCPLAQKVCRETLPCLVDVGRSHWLACHVPVPPNLTFTSPGPGNKTEPHIVLDFFTSRDIDELLSWLPTARDMIQWAGPSLRWPLNHRQMEIQVAAANGPSSSLMMYKALNRETGQVVGHGEIGALNRSNRSATLMRIIVHPDFRGQGVARNMLKELMKIAFDVFHLHRLDLNVYDFNSPAIRCYEYCGFKREGVRRESTRLDDEFWNSIMMSILEPEWRALFNKPKA